MTHFTTRVHWQARLSQCPRVWLPGCSRVHTCMRPTCVCSCPCLYQPCTKPGEFPKFNSRFTFRFRWAFWAAIGGLPFGSGQPERDTCIIILSLCKFPLFCGHKISTTISFAKPQKWREQLLCSRQQDSLRRILPTFYRFLYVNRSVPKVFLTGQYLMIVQPIISTLFDTCRVCRTTEFSLFWFNLAPWTEQNTFRLLSCINK